MNNKLDYISKNNYSFILIQIVCESLSSTCIHSQGIPAPDDDHIFHIHNYYPLYDIVHLFPCECFAIFFKKYTISDEIIRKDEVTSELNYFFLIQSHSGRSSSSSTLYMI